MMQQIGVIVVIAAAVFYLGRMAWLQLFRKKGKCESCGFAKELEKIR